MSNLYSLLRIGQSGIKAASFGVRNAGQNISNVNTPGYHRRVVLQEISSISSAMSPKLGDGVRIIGSERIVNETLDRRARDAESDSQAYEARSSILNRANVIFGDILGEGISPALDELLASFGVLAATPQDVIARNSVLASANLFATEVNRYATEIQRVASDVDSQLVVEVDRVNSLVEEIVELNELASENAKPSNDLLDRRDGLVEELSKLMRIKVTLREDKTYDVSLVENGFPLISGRSYSVLSLRFDPAGARIYGDGFGGGERELTSVIKSGEIGGLLQARDDDINSTIDSLDQFVFDFAGAVNRVHLTGFGLDGATNRPLFEPLAASAGAAGRLQVSQTMSSPDAVAASENVTVGFGDNTIALELAKLRESLVVNNLEPAEALQGMLQSFGDRVYQADIRAVSGADAATQLRELQQSVSGVSLDEELGDLMRYQQAYAGAVKVIQTADELVQELLAIKR